MAREFTYDQLMQARKALGITAPFQGSDVNLPPEEQIYTPDIPNSDEQDYQQLQKAQLVEPPVSNMQPEQKQQMEQQSIFRNLMPAAKPSRQQELETQVGRAAPIGADAGMLAGQSPASEAAPSRSLASVVGVASEQKKAPSIMDFLDFGKNELANKEGLQKATDERNTRQMLANIGAAANTFSGGLAKTGPVDNSFYNNLSKQAEQSVTDYEKQVEFQKQDPNSAHSKGLKDYFKNKLGIEIRGDASAAELEKLMPFAVREFEAKLERERLKQQRSDDAALRRELAKEDRDLKREIAGMKSEAGADKAEGKAKDKLGTDTRLIRKEIFSGPSAKAYNNFLNSERATKTIEKFMQDPTGYSDYATLLGGLKALQGDESVVRETEIRMGMDAGSFKDKILNRVERLKSGKSLQPEQRKAIMQAVSVLRDVTKEQFLQTAQPQLAQAKEMGIPLDQLIPEFITKERSPQSLVKIKDKVTGRVKGFSQEDADKLLENPEKYEQAE